MKQKSALVCLAVLAAALGGFYIYAHNRNITTTANVATGCRAKTVKVGATGNCVRDIQTMTDYMQTAELIECPFRSGRLLPITGTYDSATAAQVKVIQAWANCYYQQEGMNQNITISGIVDNDTWVELCNYAYNSPKESNSTVSPYTQASLAAGKNANC